MGWGNESTDVLARVEAAERNLAEATRRLNEAQASAKRLNDALRAQSDHARSLQDRLDFAEKRAGNAELRLALMGKVAIA